MLVTPILEPFPWGRDSYFTLILLWRNQWPSNPFLFLKFCSPLSIGVLWVSWRVASPFLKYLGYWSNWYQLFAFMLDMQRPPYISTTQGLKLFNWEIACIHFKPSLIVGSKIKLSKKCLCNTCFLLGRFLSVMLCIRLSISCAMRLLVSLIIFWRKGHAIYILAKLLDHSLVLSRSLQKALSVLVIFRCLVLVGT